MKRRVKTWMSVLIIAATGCASLRAGKDAVTHSSAPRASSASARIALAEDSEAESSQASVPSGSKSPADAADSFPAPDTSTGIVRVSSTEIQEPGRSAGAPPPPDRVHEAAEKSPQPTTVMPATANTTQAGADNVATVASADENSITPYALSLGSILHLADAQNPNVALARERINEAYARVQRAEALWLPSLRAGLNYNHHEGAIQSVAGDVFQTNRSAFGGGFGAGMYGAASPGIPGLIAQFHLSDAIFQPKIASHQAASRQFSATAARNDVLRDAATGYLELVRAEHGLAIAHEALENTGKLTDITRQYSETGQGLQSDFERMETELALRRDQLAVEQEAIQVASARLAQILHADPAIRIVTGEPVVAPLEVMNVDDAAAAYVALGLSRRPELSEQRHLVCEAIERMNREKYAPLIPSVLLGMSYGGMGGGLGTSIVNSNQRFDADAVAYWEIRNLGLGDSAARGEAASIARQTQLKEVAVLDRVAREVTEAHAQVSQRKKRLETARKGIIAAERSYQLNLQRIENAQGLPIEVLQSIQALATARRAYLNAVVDYNIAQFELCRSTGWFVDASPAGL